MFRRRHPSQSPTRRGIILLVVLALLTLFAIVGLTFVLYANAEADASRIYREAQSVVDMRPDVSPYVLMNWSMGQLIYDVDDSPNSTSAHLQSALRGHSLARDMYGWNSTNMGSNIYPFNGTGRFHQPSSQFPARNEFDLINYTYYPADGFVRDPERLGTRVNQNLPLGPYTGGWNSPYTFPDFNHLYLAAVSADGTLLSPSFHRNWGTFGSIQSSNPNWTNPTDASLKYQVLRPRPADMAGFPPPTDPTGDVKNLDGAPGGNDSIWIDLDFPVMRAPDGTKFKPLFAFLITDLDNRINLNTAGNVRGTTRTHLSNQGFGPWEVNYRKLLNGTAAQAKEWENLLIGNAGTTPPTPGRYGPDKQPGTSGSSAPTVGTRAHVYSQFDFDASNEGSGGNPTGAWSPTNGQNIYPNYPAGYSNGGAVERLNHPSLFNVFNPTGDDQRLALSNMQLLLYDGYSGTDWQNSDMGILCPTVFGDATSGGRLRHLVTTDSYDVGRPGLQPWIFNRATSGYTVAAANPYGAPTGPPVALPSLAMRATPVPPSSEFRTPGLPGNNARVDWRANDVATFGKIDLNRFLPPYPHMGQGTTQATYSSTPLVPAGTRWDIGQPAAVLNQITAAVSARQQLANDIYRLFLAVTGVPPVVAAPAPTDAELEPRRWLAQLAVNIVDYIDEDDISTPFNFYTTNDGLPAIGVGATTGNPELPRYWVFGTELPRVVLNEILTEYETPGAMPTSTTVNVWAELFNPLPAGALPAGVQPQDGQPVPFWVTATGGGSGYSPYRVVIADTNAAVNSGGLLYGTGGHNLLGTPNTPRASTADSDFATPIPTVAGGTAPQNLGPQGYMLLGPGPDRNSTIAAPRVPGTTPFRQTANMSYSVAIAGAGAGAVWTPDDRPNGISVLLRRLANPFMPIQPNPAVANYNPYMTVDYVSGVSLNNATLPATVHHSRGKKQPYTAKNNPTPSSQVLDELFAGSPTKHTLGRVNSSAIANFDWLVHLDRQLISPMELLHVSGYHPFQLTQQFVTGPGPAGKFNQVAPWLQQNTRLYRAFEFLDVHSRAAGVPLSGRIPGKVNLNTIYDLETFQALCDAQVGNTFTAAQVMTMWTALSGGGATGHRGMPSNGTAAPPITPFLGMAIGNTPGGDPWNTAATGINNTFLRTGGAAPFFAVPGTPPRSYQQYELMNKLFNNVTTRSNVFAVWVTVGFFKVVQDRDAAGNPIQPVKLGGEIGLATGQNIRHRLFVIVDRSSLTIDQSVAALSGAVPAPGPVTVGLTATSGTSPTNSIPWTITQGSVLFVGSGAARETIVVDKIAGNQITATFQQAHAAGTTITLPGNPGPQANFDTRNPVYADVVPYTAVMQ